MKLDIKTIIITLGLIAVGFVGAAYLKNTPLNLGSVAVGSSYHATTTGAFSGFRTGPVLLTDANGCTSTCPGTLGGVTVLGAAAGQMIFYDATTTDKNLRDSTQSTSTITKFSAPVSLVAGYYPIDTRFDRGLIVEMIGTQPTSTISWRE